MSTGPSPTSARLVPEGRKGVPATAAESERGRPLVLVAEDSPTQAAWLAGVLRRAGYEPLLAADGVAALESARAAGPDLILSDVDMPGLDGFELCRRIKEDPRLREIPFVMVTQRDRVTDLVRALEVGADNYVAKPLDVRVLTERVGRVMRDVETSPERAGGSSVQGEQTRGQEVLSLERSQVIEMLMATAQKIEGELGTVAELGLAITTARELEELLPALTKRVLELSGATISRIVLRRSDGTWWTAAVAGGSELVREAAGRMVLDDSMLPIPADELRSRRSYHTRYDDEGTSEPLRQLGHQLGLVQSYGWPLVVGEELIGVLVIGYDNHRSLTADEHRRFDALANQAAVAVVNARLFEQERGLRRQLEDALDAEREAHKNAMFMLAAAVEAKDGLTGAHLRRVQAYAEAVAREIGSSDAEIEEIGYSSVMHDVGKLLVPERILGKPGKLSEDEWIEMRKHPDHGVAILTDRPFFAMASDIARCHHERWDGTGYPRGLKGEEIPLAARITSVADVFDALVTKRSYKEPWPDEDAIAEIRDLRGTSFDPAVADAFLRLWESGEISRIRASLT